MIDSTDDSRDRLADDAEAYEQGLQPGSTLDNAFESSHPHLAQTLRMLRSVFQGDEGEASDDSASPPLSTIGRFKVDRCLGSGGFGSVWLAHDPILKRDVAIKVAHVGLHARSDLLQRFKQEAHLAARLHHPNIVPVFETGEDDGRLYIVSEYCEGLTLADWLKEREQLIDPRAAAQLIRQLADAVEHAHQQGLIHRDIKPANVLFSGKQAALAADKLVPRLTDFGLARDLTSDRSSTRSGMLLGTAEYMSPEQAMGKVDDHEPTTDVYSLGVLLYRLLTGDTPFSGRTEFEVIRQIAESEPVKPERRNSKAPRDLSSICLKCLEKQQTRRYATAGELRDDLDRFLREETTIARPIKAYERIGRWARRSPALAALLIVSLVSMTAIIAGMAFHLRQMQRTAIELTTALEETRKERQIASESSRRAEVARAAADTQRQIADAQRELARNTSYRSDMRLAFDLWARGQVHQVRAILERQTPGDANDLRGPEWYALDADFRAKFQRIGQHQGTVTECVLNWDGSRTYSSGVDGLVHCWDTASSGHLATFQPKIGQIHALGISADGDTLAVGGKAGMLSRARVVLLHATTGKRIRALQSHKTTIESIAFSPDGRWLAAGSRYQPVQLTRLSDDKTFSLAGDRRNRSLTFSSDSRLVCFPTSETMFAVWRIDGDQPIVATMIPGLERSKPYLSCFAPGLPLLANGSTTNNYLSLVDPQKRIMRALATDKGNRDGSPDFSCLAFSPNAKLLAAGAESGKVAVWRPSAAGLIERDVQWKRTSNRIEPFTVWTPHTASVTSIHITNNSVLITSGDDGSVARTSFTAVGGSPVRLGLEVNDAVLDGDKVLLAVADGSIRSYSLPTPGTEQADVSSCNAAIDSPKIVVVGDSSSPLSCLAQSPNGEWLAAGSRWGGVRLYDRSTGELRRVLADDNVGAEDHAVRDIEFSASGELLAATGEQALVTIYDVASGSAKFSKPLTNTGMAVAFLQADRLAVGGKFEGIRVVDVREGRLKQTIVGDNVWSFTMSHDGKRLASTHEHGMIQLMETAGGKQRPRVILGHRSIVGSAAFSANDDTLISAGWHGALQFTDVADKAVFGRLSDPDGGRQRRLLCDAHVLVSVGLDRDAKMRIWRLSEAINTTDEAGADTSAAPLKPTPAIKP